MRNLLDSMPDSFIICTEQVTADSDTKICQPLFANEQANKLYRRQVIQQNTGKSSSSKSEKRQDGKNVDTGKKPVTRKKAVV